MYPSPESLPASASAALAIPHADFPAVVRDTAPSRAEQVALRNALVAAIETDLADGLPTDRTPDLLTRLYDLGLHAEDPSSIEEGHRLLSRSLATLRDQLPAPLEERILAFASAAHAPLWDHVDVRTVIPVLELLVDRQDAAALLRLTGHYMHGPLGRQLENYRAHAVRLAHLHATLTLPDLDPPCTLHAEDRRLPDGAGPHTLAPGSWLLRCTRPDHPDVTERILLRAGEERTWDRPTR